MTLSTANKMQTDYANEALVTMYMAQFCEQNEQGVAKFLIKQAGIGDSIARMAVGGGVGQWAGISGLLGGAANAAHRSSQLNAVRGISGSKYRKLLGKRKAALKAVKRGKKRGHNMATNKQARHIRQGEDAKKMREHAKRGTAPRADLVNAFASGGITAAAAGGGTKAAMNHMKRRVVAAKLTKAAPWAVGGLVAHQLLT